MTDNTNAHDTLRVIFDDATGFADALLSAEVLAAVDDVESAGDPLSQLRAAGVLMALLKRLGAPVRNVILQNRDRSTPAMIAQMNAIAAAPDYLRVAPSREFASGAPIVFGNDDRLPAKIAIGRQDKAVAANGQRFAVQYAVVEAADLLTSNSADGIADADYSAGVAGKLRAIAGNGRLAGLKAGYQRGTAGEYRAELAADDHMTGVPAESVDEFDAPVLVRIMRAEDVTEDIGDISNQRGTSDLSPVEQAQNDAQRLSLADLDVSDDGKPTEAAALAFIAAMPESERNNLMDGKHPGAKAYDRLMATVFWKAYGAPELVRLYAQSVDAEIKTILGGMASAAAELARLDGAGDLDIRGVVTAAAELAINAKRQGVKLADFAKQADMTHSPDVMEVVRMFADNIRSAKKIGERLRAAARFAYMEFTKDDTDMFGPVEKATRDQVLGRLNAPLQSEGGSLFDSVDPLRMVELSGKLMRKVAALQAAGDASPMLAVGLANDVLAIIRELEGEAMEPVAVAPEQPAEPEAPPATLGKGMKALDRLTAFLTLAQRKVIANAMRGDEGQHFIDTAIEWAAVVDGMPKTYDTDGMGMDAIAVLHYFLGGSDWYITERDREGNGTQQAFGYAILNGDRTNAELGYISIDALVRAGAELDLFWKPIALRLATAPAEPDPVATIGKTPEQQAEPMPDPVPPAPLSDETMQNFIAIAADSIGSLRRIDVYRVLNALVPDNVDGVTRAALASWIASMRPDLAAEVTSVMAEEYPDDGWTPPPAEAPAALAAPLAPGANVLQPDSQPEAATAADPADDPQRSADIAFLHSVRDHKADMFDTGVAERMEQVIGAYPGDLALEAEWRAAVDAYTGFMTSALKAAL
ncbi:hypothetical protein [Burkholderia gladioli]|uniref:hypothetical protein n=1 Tax=Burkholderia gladioli TaxID=28095 RepID=UPI001ABBA4DC|nr:hypothetical protein [Burkholderia gladioli]